MSNYYFRPQSSISDSEKKKCPVCRKLVNKRKFVNHFAQCNINKVCGYCQSPSLKVDVRKHEERCKEKFQLIDSSNNCHTCNICKKSFPKREHAMVHISRSHNDWKLQLKDLKKSIPTPMTPEIQIGETFELQSESEFQVTIEDSTTEDITIKNEVSDTEVADSGLDFLKEFEMYSDLKMFVNNEFTFNVHKILLARASSHFHQLLQNPNGNGEIHLNSVELSCIIELLRY